MMKRKSKLQPTLSKKRKTVLLATCTVLASLAFTKACAPFLREAPNGSVQYNEGGGELGNSAAFAGDVNGDGYADIMVGARLASNSGAPLASVINRSIRHLILAVEFLRGVPKLKIQTMKPGTLDISTNEF